MENRGLRFRDPEREQLRRFKNVLDNYKISTIELRGIEVAEVCQIFERINQAGQPLNIFDIVVAKTFRPDPEASLSDAKPGFTFVDCLRNSSARWNGKVAGTPRSII